MKRRFAIIGNGTAAVEIMRILQRTEGASVVAAIADPCRSGADAVERAASAHGAVHRVATTVNDEATVELLRGVDPDWVLSVDNMRIFGRALLELPRLGCVNFHGGPLDRFAGVNPCSWAILEAATAYEVTWHVMTEVIDAGEILATRRVDLSGMTSRDAIVSCVRAGIAAFEELAPRLTAGETAGIRCPSSRRVFTRRDVPYGGLFPLTLGAEAMDRYARAVTFHPLPNTFCRPLLRRDTETILIDRFEFVAGDAGRAPGTVLQCQADAVTVALAAGRAVISTAEYEGALVDAAELAARIGLRAGEVLQGHRGNGPCLPSRLCMERERR